MNLGAFASAIAAISLAASPAAAQSVDRGSPPAADEHELGRPSIILAILAIAAIIAGIVIAADSGDDSAVSP